MNLVLIIFSFFIVLGLAYDKLVFNSHKSYLHDLMIKWWFKIGETAIPDFKKLIINKFLSSISFLTDYRIFSWQSLFFTAILSWHFTTLSAMISSYLIEGDLFLPYFTLYLVNYPLDFLTIYLTIKIAKLILHKKRIVSVFMLILYNLIIVYFISLTCLISSLYLKEYIFKLNIKSEIFQRSSDNNLIFAEYLKGQLKSDGFSNAVNIKIESIDKKFVDQFKACVYILNNSLILKWEENEIPIIVKVSAKEENREKKYLINGFRTWITSVNVYGALSTFIPTLIFLLVIIIVILSKIIIELIKYSLILLLDKFTESGIDPIKKTFSPEKFTPGTLTGILIGVFSSFIKLIIAIIKLMH